MKVEYAFLCEKAERVSSGGINAENIGGIRNLRVSSRIPEGETVEVIIFLVAMLEGNYLEAGKHTLSLALQDSKGVAKLGPGQEIDFKKPESLQPTRSSIIFDVGLPIRMPGIHRLSIMVNKIILHQIEFSVEEVGDSDQKGR